MVNELTITRPDDMHVHLRDGAELASVAGFTARRFGRAIIMPNLVPPVTTVDQALAYHARIKDTLPQGTGFEPLMTLYLTDNTSPVEIERLAESREVYAVKYYPAGATTNSDSGVTSVKNVYSVIEKLQSLSIPLLLHGEVTDPEVDIYDREQVFIESILQPLLDKFPALRVVLEHITTREAVEFVEQGHDGLAATITPQHLLFNRNDLFKGGIRPHNYCLPVLKAEQHRKAVLAAATSGSPKFFLGTDSAPHSRTAKESSCGCAGIFSAAAALEIYTEIFDQAGALERLECFASHHGADFYGLPRNQDQVTLTRTAWQIPETLPFGNDVIVPMLAGRDCQWRLIQK